MACTIGGIHTITLSNDGEVHSFGYNIFGQLGLELELVRTSVSIPNRVTALPKIKQISCGYSFTCCVDYEGFLWTFGHNSMGQQGIRNSKSFNFPQRIQEIPLVDSVACGYEHTLIITIDSDLWSCGNNEQGQLCLGHRENRSTFQQTSFSNVSKISLGYTNSIFQNNQGEIYSCDHNAYGELGLGHNNSPQITPTHP